MYEGYFDSTVDEEKLGYLTDVFTPISWSGGGYCYTYAGGAGSGPLVDNMQEFIIADSNGKIEVDSANFMKFTVYFNDEDKNEMKKLWIFNEEDFYYVYRKYRGKLETFRSCRWRYIYMQRI